MKKIRRLGTLFFLGLFILCSCSNNQNQKVETSASSFLKALQDGNLLIAEEKSEWAIEELQALEVKEDDLVEGVDLQIQKKVLQKLTNFSYEIKGVEVEKENAKVKVKLELYDFNKALTTGEKEASKKLNDLNKNSSLKNSQKEILRIFYENMEKCEDKQEFSITLLLIQKNGEWIVSRNNDEFQHVLLKNVEDIISYLE